MQDVDIKTDPQTGESRGFGFLLYKDEASIEEVVNNGPHNLGMHLNFYLWFLVKNSRFEAGDRSLVFSIRKIRRVFECIKDGKRIDPKKATKNSKIFIGGIKPETTNETLEEYFTTFGEVESIDR